MFYNYSAALMAQQGPFSSTFLTYLMEQGSSYFGSDIALVYDLTNARDMANINASGKARLRFMDASKVDRLVKRFSSPAGLAELTFACAHPEQPACEALITDVLRDFKHTGNSLPFTNAERRLARGKIIGLTQLLGPVNFLLTIAPNDANNPLALRLTFSDGGCAVFPAEDAGYAEYLSQPRAQRQWTLPPLAARRSAWRSRNCCAAWQATSLPRRASRTTSLSRCTLRRQRQTLLACALSPTLALAQSLATATLAVLAQSLATAALAALALQLRPSCPPSPSLPTLSFLTRPLATRARGCRTRWKLCCALSTAPSPLLATRETLMCPLFSAPPLAACPRPAPRPAWPALPPLPQLLRPPQTPLCRACAA
jgi:hypothetical protein